MRVDQVPIVLARWRALVDTAGEEERAARDYAERSLHVSPLLDGAWRTDGNLTAELGEIFRNAIDRRARAMYRAEKAEADANGDKVDVHRRATPPRRPPRAPPPSHRRRRRRQRRERPRHHRRHRRHQAPRREARRDRRRDRSRHPRVLPRPRCGGAATPASPASSPHPPPPPSTSATPPGSPTARNAERWPPETAAAPSPAATDHPAGPAPTTSSTGSTADPPASGTKPCSAPSTTTASTKAASNVERLPNGELEIHQPRRHHPHRPQTPLQRRRLNALVRRAGRRAAR